MIYIGIDPGFDGAIVSLQLFDGVWVPRGDVMPITGQGTGREINMLAIAHRLKAAQACAPLFVSLEKVGPRPYQAVSGAFRFAFTYGQIQGILSTLGIPFELVTPQEWKKVVLKGLPWRGSKAASIQYCQKKYPEYNLLRTPRCKSLHDGLADALCLAEYGRMTHG